jgi:hypothetical protein
MGPGASEGDLINTTRTINRNKTTKETWAAFGRVMGSDMGALRDQTEVNFSWAGR